MLCRPPGLSCAGFGASDKIVELLAAVARVDLQRVAAGVTKRLEKQCDKIVDVQFDVLGRDAVVNVEPFCNLGVHSHVFDD